MASGSLLESVFERFMISKNRCERWPAPAGASWNQYPTVELDSKMLTGCLALPSNPLGEGMIEYNSARFRAVVHTAAIIPTLFRIKDNRRLTFIGIRNKKICHANVDTHIAAVTNLGINYDGIGRRIAVGKRVSLCLSHAGSPFML